MKMRRFVTILSAVLFALLFSCAAGAAELPKFDDSTVIVVTKPDNPSIRLFSSDTFGVTLNMLGITETNELMNLSEGTSGISLFSESGGKIIELTLPEPGEDNVIKAVNALNASGAVKYAGPNYYYYLDAMPDDSEYYADGNVPYYQFSIIGAEAVWKKMDIDCSDVTIAVLDTGILIGHVDLKDNIWINPGEIPDNGIDDDGNGYIDDVSGWDFAMGDNDPDDGYIAGYDMQGHGTHVSGIASGVTGNDKGIASLAGNIKTGSAKIVPLKIFYDKNKTKATTEAAVVAAIKYIKEKKISIANCSWGGSNSTAIKDAIKSCSDTLFVTAAGNNAKDLSDFPVYPARYTAELDNVISVGASTANDTLASYSNYGKYVDIAAPGDNIWSTANTDLKKDAYKYLSGTSQATPLVASMAALLKGKYPSITPSDMKRMIISGSPSELRPTNGHSVNGARRLNAELVMLTAKSYFCEIVWKDEDGNVIDRTSVPYNTIPSHEPLSKEKGEYEYTFAGWRDEWGQEPSYVTEDMEYTAHFTKDKAKYTVVWANYDNSPILTETYTYGDTPKYIGNIPIRPADDRFSYTFGGWIPEPEPVTEDTQYTAGFRSHTKSYPITWLDEDGSELYASEVEYGVMPKYPYETPSKESTPEYEYVFDNWDPALSIVTGAATYTAKYAQRKRQYTITWRNYDGTELSSESIDYGKMPYYSSDTPQKPDSDDYRYTFSGWDPEPVPVTEDADYTAVYDEKKLEYTIIWRDYDGTELLRERVSQGDMPEYPNGIPSRPGTDEIHYVFTGWEPELTPVTGDAEYTATYEERKPEYTITWKDFDGTVLLTEVVAYGETPSYKYDTPQKPGTDEVYYTFAGWNPSPIPATEDAEYIATYDQHIRKYTITWKNYDGTVLLTEQVAYGETPDYTHGTPQKPGTNEVYYTFTGWEPQPVPVTGDAEYTATYSENKHEYIITWKNYDGTVLLTEKLEYGEMPAYRLATPKRPSDNEDIYYTFFGWEPKPMPVAGNADYIAQFTETVREYEITWRDQDGNILETTKAAAGEIPEYSGEYEKKKPEKYDVYIPAWEPEPAEAHSNAEYTMKYVSADMLKTNVTLTDEDGASIRKGRAVSQITARIEFPNAVLGLSERYALTVKPFTAIIAMYDENGALIGVAERTVNGTDLLDAFSLRTYWESKKTVSSVRLYIWNETGSMLPIRDAKDIL